MKICPLNVILLTNADPKIRKKSCTQVVKHNIPKMLQIVSCVRVDLSRIFHENYPFSYVVDNKHDAAPSLGTVKNSILVWNSRAICLLCRVLHIRKIAWKPFHPFSVLLPAKTDRGYNKKRNTSKMFRIAPSVISYPANVMKIKSSVFVP